MSSSQVGYDEWRDAQGQLRPHWVTLDEGLRRIGPVALARRWEEARRLIRDNGITYGHRAGTRRGQEVWELDPIPALLPFDEWSWLQQALAQRAALLRRILEDIYGSQELVLSGQIPHELVYAHPGWLRPCVGLVFPPAAQLLLYAADVVRDPQGRWMVLRDRTQSPTGFGFALENRLVVARMFPDLFKDSQAHPLAPFFHSLRRTLSGLTGEGESPRIVVLSAGPSSPGYFEDAYLSQYLGCILVEGGDLTVRGNHLYLKMLDGLQPVEVVVRRVQDASCDALELRSDGWAGVPGLVQAVRSGNVVVTNALGSGWLESPALAQLLPELCRSLLNEDLMLPSLPSAWCGRESGRRWVEDRFSEMVIRPTFPTSRERWVVHQLDEEKRLWLQAELARRPQDFVGQSWVDLPSFPSLWEHQLASRPGHYRFFVAHMGANPLLAGDDNRYGYIALPGGTVRTRKPSLPSSHWVGSKDLWWLRQGESPLPSKAGDSGAATRLTRSGGDLPSRSADNFYWLGRYVERVEFFVRLARVCLNRESERTIPRGLEEELLGLWPAFDSPHDFQKRLESWASDHEKPDGLANLLARVQQLGDMLRDRLSVDSLAVLNSLRPAQHVFREPNQVLNYLEQLTVPLWAWTGMTAESLHRGHGYRFLELGRRLERAWHTVRLLRALVSNHDGTLLEAVLEVGESSRVYRRRYQTTMHRPGVVDLLLADEGSPRSVAYQLKQLQEHLQALPHDHDSAEASTAELVLIKARAQVRLFAVARDDSETLGALLETLQEDLPSFSDALSQIYLTHLRPRQQREALVDQAWSEEV